MTVRDDLAIAMDEATLVERFTAFRSSIKDREFQSIVAVKDYRNWNIADARTKVRSDKKWREKIVHVNYRPFDKRWIYYSPDIITYPNFRVMNQFDGKNIGLITSRIHKGEHHAHEFVTREMTEIIFLSSKSSNNAYVFPLYLNPDKDELALGQDKSVNISKSFLDALTKKLGLKLSPNDMSPEDVFCYIYATLSSPEYRRRYNELLKIDFPKVPLVGDRELFHSLKKLGFELITTHLLESPRLNKANTVFTGGNSHVVEKPTWAKNTVYIDKAQTIGFKGVTEEVWNFHVGGYQVCDKWLKDRKGRKLNKDDVEHYQKIVVAVSETIRLMAEIDKVIDEHGGWPGAFQSTK